MNSFSYAKGALSALPNWQNMKRKIRVIFRAYIGVARQSIGRVFKITKRLLFEMETAVLLALEHTATVPIGATTLPIGSNQSQFHFSVYFQWRVISVLVLLETKFRMFVCVKILCSLCRHFFAYNLLANSSQFLAPNLSNRRMNFFCNGTTWWRSQSAWTATIQGRQTFPSDYVRPTKRWLIDCVSACAVTDFESLGYTLNSLIDWLLISWFASKAVAWLFDCVIYVIYTIITQITQICSGIEWRIHVEIYSFQGGFQAT